ncbi:MAG: NUDIX domain-containing protein [Oscillospiraceae bacterium]
MHLQEKTVDTEPIFDGKIIKVRKDKAELENGSVVTRELVIHPGGVCVVPVNEKGEVYLVKQFRYPFQEVLTEIPAGKLEVGEDHRSAGLRELKEEVGAECESFEYLGVMYPSVAYLTEKIHMYLATGLSFGEQSLDEDEFLDVEKMPLSQAVEMVISGEIKDGKTQTALLLAARKLGI